MFLNVWITTNWKILKEMGRPDHLTCLLRNLYAGQEAIVRTRHGTSEWLKIGEVVQQGCVLSACLSNFYAEHIIRNTRLDESQAGIRIAWENINNLRYTDNITLMAESKKEPNSLLMRVKEENEKAGLKSIEKNPDHGIWSHHFMANRRSKVQKVRFSFLGLQIYCGQWLQPWNKKMPSPWKESYDKSRQHIKKQRHHFADKGLYSQSYGFSNSHVWMTECQRIDALELWCWRRLLRVSWTARRSNRSILKKTNHIYSLEGLMLKLKLQYFGHLMWKANSLENILMLGKIKGKRRGRQRMR